MEPTSNFLLDDDLVLEYLAESREHLATIENDLLMIEQAGANIDERLVNRVFRAAHSIKGGAGFFELVKIKELAHRTENVLDLVRSGQMVPNSEIVSILLLAFDKLRDLILNYSESNQTDISEFTSALGRLAEKCLNPTVDEPPPNVAETTLTFGAKTFSVSKFDFDQSLRNGRKLYLLEYDLIHDVQRRGKTPLALLNELINVGDILCTSFDLESAGTLDDTPSNVLLLDVLYATVLDVESLEEVLNLPLERIRPAHKNETEFLRIAAPSETKSANRPSAGPVAPPVQPLVQTLGPTESMAKPSAPPPSGAASSSPSASADTTIRLNVALLDSLMTLAGELVLGRNQLNESIRSQDQQGILAAARRVSSVTSELQEAVSLTRMQPVSSLFSKFPRLVRDLSSELGKDVQLKLDGGDVELDKTILEGLSDPLTHMVRNCVDHGIEPPSKRTAVGKSPTGSVVLRARHQAGQVVIEVTDDGKGLSAEKIVASALAKGLITAEQAQSMSEYDKLALIFMPGVSTAEKLSAVSGRGVGMDVVKTNLDKLGGKVEIHSTPGTGSTFRIKLPLTLAIIPSLLVSDGGQRFAIPQVNVGELIRIPASQLAQRIERAGDAEVVTVRDRLVPLVYLGEALGTGRNQASDEQNFKAINIVLVDTGTLEYGLVVGELHDTEEIVVKPMGRHLQSLQEYAGATVLGDGKVAVILDVAGLAERVGLSRTSVSNTSETKTQDLSGDLQSLLLFQNAPGEDCAIPIELVTRVERIDQSQVQYLAGRRTMQYGGASLPLVALHDVAAVDELTKEQQWVVVVFERAGRPIGLLAAEPLDMIEARLELDTVTLRQTGVAGSTLLNHRTTLMLDIFELADAVRKRWPEADNLRNSGLPGLENAGTVLVAEDSDFFRGQIKRLIEAVGYKVLAAEDGQAAWDMLDSHAGEISVVTTDVEMPRMDGLALTRRIRADSRFSTLPVIALSSLAGEEEMNRGLALGVTEYQVKLDQDQLLESIRKAVTRDKEESLSRF